MKYSIEIKYLDGSFDLFKVRNLLEMGRLLERLNKHSDSMGGGFKYTIQEIKE